jgi:hypothetical protein
MKINYYKINKIQSYEKKILFSTSKNYYYDF